MTARRFALARHELSRAALISARSREVSLAEYEARWRDQLDRRDAATRTPVEALRESSYGDAALCALVGSSVAAIAAPDFFAGRGLWLAGLLRRVRGEATTLIDLGAGAGKNLPAQALAGFTEIVAVEPTRAGCAALRDMSRRIGVPVQVIRAELPHLPLRAGRRAVVFTNHVLEQLPGRTEACLDAIAALGDVRVVHIEPSFHPGSFLRHPLAETVDMIYRRRRRYGGGLSICLMRRHLRGEIDVRYHRSCGYSPRVINVPTLAVWEPRSS